MTKTVVFIECGVNGCKGHLEVIAHSHGGGGVQYGDPIDHTFFLECPTCHQLFYTHHGDPEGESMHEFDPAHPGRLIAYCGRLSKEEIVAHADKIRGHFYPQYDEDRVLAKCRPEDWSDVCRAEKVYIHGREQCVVYVPAELEGRQIKMQVVPTNSR